MNKQEIQEKIKNNGEKRTVNEIIGEFGTNLSYNQVMEVIDLFSKENQEKIKKEISKKQQEFWDNPRQVEYYKKVHLNTPLVDEHYALLLKIIDPKDGEVIVDLCCGTGNLIKQLIKNNVDFKMIGIDYSQRCLDQIESLVSDENRKKLKLITYDTKEKIPLEDSTIDKLISNWGIIYLEREDLIKTLKEVNRVLKPGGTFILSSLIKGGHKIPYTETEFFSKLIKGIIKKPVYAFKALAFEKRCKKYFREYKTEEIEELIANAGFEITEKKITIGTEKVGKSILFISKKK